MNKSFLRKIENFHKISHLPPNNYITEKCSMKEQVQFPH